MQAHLQSMASTIADSGDPEAAMASMQTQLTALQYLHENLPRPKISPSEFYNPERRLTHAEVRDFEERCAAATDPFYIVRKIEDGHLSKTHIDAVTKVFPGIVGLIQQRIKSMGYENQLKESPLSLPYNARQRLARLQSATAPATAPATAAPMPAPAAPAPMAAAPSAAAPRQGSFQMKSTGSVASLSDRLMNK